MAYSLEIKEKAKKLRNEGFSLKEISGKLHIAKSTASTWLEAISLSSEAQQRLEKMQILGRYKSILIKRKLHKEEKEAREKLAISAVRTIPFSPELARIYCALLWWCEGNKDTGEVRFTNSDPTLIQNFLFLFRSSFVLDELKFRIHIHIHDYHNDQKQKEFWSKLTKIPIKQFHKSYNKLHTGKRKHKNYQGCIRVIYYDAKIAKELEAIYNAFTLTSGGVR